MHADRVNILHITDGDCSIVSITHYFIFNFLITLDTLFNKYLMNRRKSKSIFHHNNKFIFIISKATACTAKSKGRTKNDRKADTLCSSQSVLKIFRNFTGENRLAETFAKLFEKLSVLCTLNCFKFCAENFNITFLKHTLFSKLNSKVKSCLSAK